MQASTAVSHMHDKDIKPTISIPSFATGTRPSPSDSIPTADQIARCRAWARARGTYATTEEKYDLIAASLQARADRERAVIRGPALARPSRHSIAMDVELDDSMCPELASPSSGDVSSGSELATPPSERVFARRGAMRPPGIQVSPPSVRKVDTRIEEKDGRIVMTRYEVMEQATDAGFRVYRRVAVTTTEASPRHRASPYSVPVRRGARKASFGGGGCSPSQLARLKAPFVPKVPSLPPKFSTSIFQTPSISSRRSSTLRLDLRLPNSHPSAHAPHPFNQNRRPAPSLKPQHNPSSDVITAARNLQLAAERVRDGPTDSTLATQPAVSRRESGMLMLGTAIELIESTESSICGRRGKYVLPLRLL